MVKIIATKGYKSLNVTLTGNIIQQYYGDNENLRNNQTNEPIQCQISLSEIFETTPESLIFLCKFNLYSIYESPLKLDFIKGHLQDERGDQVGDILLDEFIVEKNTVIFKGSHKVTNPFGLFLYGHDIMIFSLSLRTSDIPESDIKLFYYYLENIPFIKGKKRLEIS